MVTVEGVSKLIGKVACKNNVDVDKQITSYGAAIFNDVMVCLSHSAAQSARAYPIFWQEASWSGTHFAMWS